LTSYCTVQLKGFFTHDSYVTYYPRWLHLSALISFSPPVQNFWLRAGSHVSKNRKKKREKESGKVVGMMG